MLLDMESVTIVVLVSLDYFSLAVLYWTWVDFFLQLLKCENLLVFVQKKKKSVNGALRANIQFSILIF